MPQPQRLEQAVAAVNQVKTHQEHAADVDQRHPGVLEAREHVCVDVAREEGGRGHAPAQREVGEMEEHEGQDQRPRVLHGAGRIREGTRLLALVSHRPRRPPAQNDHRRRVDMHAGRQDHHRTRGPEEKRGSMQQLPVAVEQVRALEEQQVAEHVLDQEAEQDEARERHQDLDPDGGLQERPQRCHGVFLYHVVRAARVKKPACPGAAGRRTPPGRLPQ
jgi:hypothetical protein